MRLLLTLIFLINPLLAGVEKKAPTGVQISLISQNASIAAGKTFRVGLKIHHLEGYHTYWQNPGIAGVPTNLIWHLPAGFTAGPIQWPCPEKTMMAVYPVHGYERDVLLMVDIQAPKKIDRPDVTLKADASWMACANGCFPGSAKLEIVLPISNTPAADTNTNTTASFAQATEEIPVPLEHWTVELLAAKDAKEIKLHLKPDSTAVPTPTGIYFFSSDGQISSDQPQRVETGADGSIEISLTRSEQSPKGKTSLPGVIKAATPFSTGGRDFALIDPLYKEVP